MRRRILAVAAAAALTLFGWVAPAHADAEAGFVAQINAERAAQGLAPLQVYWDLVDDARAHSQRMAADGTIFHNPNLAAVCSAWQALGENVGVGASVDSLHQAFMSSPAHRGNILGDYNYVGVGVVQEGADRLWVTVVFMRGPAGLVDGGAEAPTTTIATATTSTIPPTTTTTTVADPPPPQTPTTTVVPAGEVIPASPRAVETGTVGAPAPQPVGEPGLLHPIME